MRISLLEAAERLLAGQVVAVPTETVYGLAASIKIPEAIKTIYKLKNRPLVNPLIVHIAHQEEIMHYTQEHPPGVEQLAKTFWPGPFTCILPAQEERVPAFARAHLSTVGIRIPAHPLTHQLLKITGPLVMPSANLSGRPSATLPKHVEEDFGLDFPILDGGACTQGVESTILLYQANQWMIGRLGALAPECFAPLLGYQPVIIQKQDHLKPVCPGQLFRHYAPQAELILGEINQQERASVILGFNGRIYPHSQRIIRLGSLEHPQQVAGQLYRVLRQLDQEKIQVAWVDMDFPRHGLWLTIAERLKRAGEPITQQICGNEQV